VVNEWFSLFLFLFLLYTNIALLINRAWQDISVIKELALIALTVFCGRMAMQFRMIAGCTRDQSERSAYSAAFTPSADCVSQKLLLSKWQYVSRRLEFVADFDANASLSLQ
jgi:hypothetical protein